MKVIRDVTLVFPAAVALAGLLLNAPLVSAQVSTGTITGTVTLEATGDPVHGASVVVLRARRSAVTAADGSFQVASVPAGTYEIIARREHLSAARQIVTVVAGETVSVTMAMTLESLHEEVVVTGAAGGLSTAFDAFNAVASLDDVEIARNLGPTIADVLEHQPGVARRAFGAGSSRPIIRGFDGDRVLIMTDGVRTGDLSSQSGDHGVSIDPAGLQRLELIKGPATLLFGSNAIGGVVNAITPQDAFRTSPFSGALGGVTVDAGSANAQAGANASVQWGDGRWHVWAGGGGRRTGDYGTPVGTIENSGTRLASGRFGAGWVGRRTFFSAGATIEDGRFGVPFAGEFHGHEEGEEEEEEEEEHVAEIGIRSNRRDLRFDTGLHHLGGRFLDAAKLTIGHTMYGHDEVESVEGSEEVGTVFDNDTTTVRVELEQTPRERLTGRMGVEFFARDFSAVGEEALAPPTKQKSLAAFVYEEVPVGRVALQFGGRIERNQYRVSARSEIEEPRDEEGDDHEGHDHDVPTPRDRSFTGASGSFGVRTNIGTHGAIVANLTAATRAPALEELYNFGPHVGTLTFEIGNPELDLERTLGIDVSLRSRAAHASGELNFFHYGIRNFVFLDVTDEIVDGLAEAEFLQGDSRFTGVEASGHLDVHEHLHVNAAASFVRARLTETGEDLPRIPPFSARVNVQVPWNGLTIGPEVVFTARQGRVFRDETPTAGSTVLNLDATYFVAREHATHTVALKAYNLTNETYRLHTSFIKDLAPEMGRGVRVTYSIRFF